MTPKEDLLYQFEKIYELTDMLYGTMNHLAEYSKYEIDSQKIKILNFNDITYDLEECYKKVIELCIEIYR